MQYGMINNAQVSSMKPAFRTALISTCICMLFAAMIVWAADRYVVAEEPFSCVAEAQVAIVFPFGPPLIFIGGPISGAEDAWAEAELFNQNNPAYAALARSEYLLNTIESEVEAGLPNQIIPVANSSSYFYGSSGDFGLQPVRAYGKCSNEGKFKLNGIDPQISGQLQAGQQRWLKQELLIQLPIASIAPADYASAVAKSHNVYIIADYIVENGQGKWMFTGQYYQDNLPKTLTSNRPWSFLIRLDTSRQYTIPVYFEDSNISTLIDLSGGTGGFTAGGSAEVSIVSYSLSGIVGGGGGGGPPIIP